MKRSLKDLAEQVGGRALGNARVDLTGVSNIGSAAPGDLVFVEDEKHLRRALESCASAVVAGEFAAAETRTKPLLIASQPRLAFARAAQISAQQRRAKRAFTRAPWWIRLPISARTRP